MNMNWVPVTQELPNEDIENYLITCVTCVGKYSYVTTAFYRKDKGFYCIRNDGLYIFKDHNDDVVTAWMKKPQPYKRKRKFVFSSWNFDCDGDAYILDKDECPVKDDVPEYICRNDHIDRSCKPEMVVEEGWCAFRCRSDWYEQEGEPCGSYFVCKQKERPKYKDGKPLPGYFPVWIVRKGSWY